MASVNEITLIGNLGGNPEIKVINGVKKAVFSLATEDVVYKSNGEIKKETDWHRIVCWGGLAENAERFLRKGKQVFVSGKLKQRTYQDKNGDTRYICEIVANTALLTGDKPSFDETLAHRNQQPSNLPSTIPNNASNSITYNS